MITPAGLAPGRRALAAALSVNLCGVLPLFLTGAMAVQIGRDLHVDAAGIGLLIAGLALLSFLFSAPFGARVGTLGISRSLRLAAAASAAALLGAAAAPNRTVLAIALGVAGLANALGQTASNALVAARVRAQRYGLAYAIKQSAIPLSILIGGLAVPLIAVPIGWRGAFALGAGLAIVALWLIPPAVQPGTGRAEQRVDRSDLPAVWLLSAGLVAAVVAATSIGAHAVSAAVAAGFAEGPAGLLLATGGLLGLTVRLLAGARADRVSSGALGAAVFLIVLGALGWAAMATMAPVWFVAGLLAANAFGWGWPGLVHLAVARRFPEATAAASGITQTGVSLGLLVGPPLIGFLAVTAGWRVAWLAAAASALIGAAMIVAARRSLSPRRTPGP